jgi:pyrimidine operon attenuation protein/uracil phosphoribosyltransferase
LDALSDFGRPSVVRLAVLVERGGRELPIQADFVGVKMTDVPWDHRVQVKFSEVDGGTDGIIVGPRK